MAEIKITDLPLMSLDDFTSNDRFLMIDNGDARAMTKAVFEEWVAANVQGVQGVQGVAGRDGLKGANGTNGSNGADGLSAYELALLSGYVGTLAQWQTSLKGSTGATGTNGTNGWSPAFKVLSRGSDESVLQLFDWFGGTGTKPTITGYVGESGIVTNITNALSIKGSKGEQGIQGIQGVAGNDGVDGVDGRTVDSIVFNPDLSVTVTFTDGSTSVSGTPPVQYGWATYKDGQYVSGATFDVSTNTQSVLPNSAAVKIENLPTGVTSFYNSTTQKYLMTDVNGWYEIRVKFTVSASNQSSYINVSMSKDTSDIPYSEDRVIRGDNVVQDLSFSTQVYGDTALASNGMTIRVRAFDRAISIYNIEVMIAKTI